MGKRADWPWWHKGSGPDDYRVRELLRAILDLNAYYGEESRWLWRGQANSKYLLDPAVHTRVSKSGSTVDDAAVAGATQSILNAARVAKLDTHEQTRLPDLALLALLQHYGAATPLLDVSLDPLVGLYMAVVSRGGDLDDKDGVLFAIRRPRLNAAQPFDSRNFSEIYNALDADKVYFYTAPDVSERLKIQRGHFLLGRVSTADPRVGISLTVEPTHTKVNDTWLASRMNQRGRQGPPTPATSDVAFFRIPSKFKPALKGWLEERTDLTRDYVYPTPWHHPHLEAFCKSHGRDVSA